MMELIPGRYIGKENPSFIIAEIGQNHQGSFEIAKNLIDAARVYFIYIKLYFQN